MVLHPSFGAGSTPAVDEATGLVLEPAWQTIQNSYMPREQPQPSGGHSSGSASAPAPGPASGGGGGDGYPSLAAGDGAGSGGHSSAGSHGGAVPPPSYAGQFPTQAGGGTIAPAAPTQSGSGSGSASVLAPTRTHEEEVGERLAARFDELGLDDDGAPEEFMCPITYEIMNDPVIAADGHTYERSSVQSWFAKGNMRSPKTGADMTTTTMFPNHSLRSRIMEWRENAIAEAEKMAAASESPTPVAGPEGGSPDSSLKPGLAVGVATAAAAGAVPPPASSSHSADPYAYYGNASLSPYGTPSGPPPPYQG